MYRRFSTASIVILALWSVLGVNAHRGAQSPQNRTEGQSAAQNRSAAQQPQQGQRRMVDFNADIMRTIKLGPDSMAMSLQGNVVFYHNGAIITCDSAVRYNDKHMECFFNVVINKDNTYIYGDKADYNGDINTARVYSPLIKIVDDDVVMHTYNFSFNTLTNVGTYSGKGTVSQKDKLLESMRGYYYADTREVVCVDQVEIRNEEYQMQSDSVKYNMDTEVAEFFVKSYIWNHNGEILSALRGLYNTADSSYHFTKDSYVLTGSQEMWSDTLDYNSRNEDAVLRRNIQIRDDEQQVISFGDYGLWWGQREEAMLTLDPQALSFDPKEDTLYMRSDSMFLYTVSRHAAERVREMSEQSAEDELVMGAARRGEREGTLLGSPSETAADSLAGTIAADSLYADSMATGVVPQIPSVDERIAETADSLRTAGESLDPGVQEQEKVLSSKELKAIEKERKREEQKKARELKAAEKERKREEQNKEKELKAAEKAAEKAAKKQEETPHTDEEGEHGHHDHEMADSLIHGVPPVDSLARAVADSTLALHKTKTDSLITYGKTEEPDSMVRIVRAYRNVRIFRNDFQAVCDSLVAFSIDSTAHLYIDPVMWNGANQIKSEIIDLYSKNQQLTKAVYTGAPIMSSEVDPERFNQIKGKVIEALFRDNEIFRTDVNGNAQTLYYMTEEDSLGHVDVVGFLVAESATISFDIEDRQVIRITYRGKPVYTIFPIDKIPPEQERRLPGFVWEIHRKPALEDVFTRTIRPSQREEYETMKTPLFRTTRDIMEHREAMINGGIWRDRNDVISDEALQFVRSLGYRTAP